MKKQIIFLIPVILSILLAAPIFYWIRYDHNESGLGLLIHFYHFLLIIAIAFYGYGLAGMVVDYHVKPNHDSIKKYMLISFSISLMILIVSVICWRVFTN